MKKCYIRVRNGNEYIINKQSKNILNKDVFNFLSWLIRSKYDINVIDEISGSLEFELC